MVYIGKFRDITFLAEGYKFVHVFCTTFAKIMSLQQCRKGDISLVHVWLMRKEYSYQFNYISHTLQLRWRMCTTTVQPGASTGGGAKGAMAPPRADFGGGMAPPKIFKNLILEGQK